MDVVIPKVALPTEPKPAPTKEVQAGINAGGHAPEAAHEAYAVFEQRDEAMIVDALKGRYIEDFVFRYCRRHKSVNGKLPAECSCTDVVVGLSWVGVQEAAREYKGIQIPIEKVVKTETAESIEVLVEAIDSKTGSSRIGIAAQPRKMRVRTGQIIDDEFATAKAVAKAQRNAIRPLLPVTLIKAWIEAKLRGPAALPRPAQTAPELPPAAPAGTPVPQNGNGSNGKAFVPAQSRTTPTNGTGTWHPSPGQIRRIYGVAHGANVSREQVQELLKAVCGVDDPEKISSREKYEALCASIQNGGVPF